MTVDLLYVGTNLDPSSHRRLHVRLSVKTRLTKRNFFRRDTTLNPPILRGHRHVARIRLAARHAMNHRLQKRKLVSINAFHLRTIPDLVRNFYEFPFSSVQSRSIPFQLARHFSKHRKSENQNLSRRFPRLILSITVDDE